MNNVENNRLPSEMSLDHDVVSEIEDMTLLQAHGRYLLYTLTPSNTDVGVK